MSSWYALTWQSEPFATCLYYSSSAARQVPCYNVFRMICRNRSNLEVQSGTVCYTSNMVDGLPLHIRLASSQLPSERHHRWTVICLVYHWQRQMNRAWLLVGDQRQKLHPVGRTRRLFHCHLRDQMHWITVYCFLFTLTIWAKLSERKLANH